MVFESLNGSFSGIHSMVVWFYYLPGTGVTGEKRFYGGSGLIVGDVEDWFVPSFGEVVEDSAEGSDNVVT